MSRPLGCSGSVRTTRSLLYGSSTADFATRFFFVAAFVAYRAYHQNGGIPNLGLGLGSGARRSPAAGAGGGGAFAPPSPPNPPPHVPATLQPTPISYRYNQYERSPGGPPFGIGNPPPPRYTVRAAQPAAASGAGTGSEVAESGSGSGSGSGAGGAWPCAGDAVACVVEEWFY